ncbi:MAG: shikimate dehydrogenase [Bacteroidales bacterium]|nr:shikimate dehydrogenase [Bacteroidales bacterium]
MKTYALIGKPLSHSFSRKYFKEKFEQNQVSADYFLKTLDSIQELRNWIEETPELEGFNVTMPYKKAILPYIDDLDKSAKVCGNVNCVKLIRENNTIKLKAYNTDYYGFQTSLKESFDISSLHTALILGSGGVSQTLAAVLEQEGIEFKIVSRNPKNCEREISYEDASNTLEQYQLIINATPCGMHPLESTLPPLSLDKLTPSHCVFDLIYNPTETLLLKNAIAKGCKTTNGYRMLTLQADKSWEIWQNNKI